MSEETPSADENIVLEPVPDPYALVKAFMAKYPHWPTVVEGSVSPVIDKPAHEQPWDWSDLDNAVETIKDSPASLLPLPPIPPEWHNTHYYPHWRPDDER